MKNGWLSSSDVPAKFYTLSITYVIEITGKPISTLKRWIISSWKVLGAAKNTTFGLAGHLLKNYLLGFLNKVLNIFNLILIVYLQIINFS